MKKALLLSLFILFAFSCSDDSDEPCQEGCGTVKTKAYGGTENTTYFRVEMDCSGATVEFAIKGNYFDEVNSGDYICRGDFE